MVVFQPCAQELFINGLVDSDMVAINILGLARGGVASSHLLHQSDMVMLGVNGLRRRSVGVNV